MTLPLEAFLPEGSLLAVGAEVEITNDVSNIVENLVGFFVVFLHINFIYYVLNHLLTTTYVHYRSPKHRHQIHHHLASVTT